MNNEIWQQLLSLESEDIVQKWFKRIHKNTLNGRRTKEINSAAKQAREYFRNSANANHYVKPLLTYYGVTSLSRALILLLKKNGGEETLSQGHGIETVSWSKSLCGKITFDSFLNLKIETCSGLYEDLLEITNNKINLHVNSSSVDWGLNYNISKNKAQISLRELFQRIPDLEKDFGQIDEELLFSNIVSLTYSEDDGIKIKTNKNISETLRKYYQDLQYNITEENETYCLSYNGKDVFDKLPMFIHSYIHKMFGSIPSLYLTIPFDNNYYVSQLCITYLVSYYLGMLVRYFPTQWMSTIQGNKGDMLWPTINRCQHLVENTFPELVIEMINDILDRGWNSIK